MKNFGHFCTNFILIVIAMVFLDSSKILAQRASAEYISSILPTSLETGQEVKDGIQNVTYHDNILYVVNIWAGIQVIDVSNKEAPKEIGKYLNDHRAHNFYIDGNYGYLSDELEGVHIIDISNPSLLTRVGKITTKGNAFWVVAKNPYVYVAEEETGVSIYDVSNPASPIALGNFDTPGWAWEMIIRDDILYVADKTGGLQILNVSDKNNPVRMGQFSGPKNARSISLDENHIYMANGAECVCIVDVTNPKFPTLVSKMTVSGYIPDVFKSGKNLFMANETNKSVEIVDVSTLPEMIPGGSYQAEDKVYGLWKEDVYVFVAANSKTLILRYNSPPTLETFPDTVINEQEIITIAAKAFDPDGDILSYEINNMPEGAIFDSTNGILTWTPTYEQSGDYANITIRVIEFTDSRLTDEESFKISVNHVNRPPSLPEVDDQMVNENEILAMEIAEGKDEDKEDTGKLVYTAENLPEGAVFDAQKRILTWTPTYEQSGTYVLDFVLSDQAGGVDRDASTITVVHIDRKPVIQVVQNKTVNENETLEFLVEGKDPDKEDQNAISYSVIGLPEGADFEPASRKFTWTPGYDKSGVYENLTFVMRAGNLADSSTINISVNHVNRPPIITEIANKTVDEEKMLSFVISGSDLDIEDDGKLVFSATQLPQGAVFNADSMKFNWTPTYEQSGTFENVTFTVQDPSGLTQSTTMSIMVNHVNRPPILADVPPQAVDENMPLSVNLQGSDPDKEDQNSLQYSADKLPEGAILEGNNLAWTPTYEQSGEYTIQFSLSDGKLSDSKSVVLTVNHINRPPSVEPVEPKMVDENKPMEFKIIAGDPDKEDAGSYNLSATQLPQGAVFTPETATFSWTPTFDQSGTYSVTFNNTDAQGLVTSQTVELTVNHVNRTPVLNPITAQTAEENVPLTIVIPAGEDPDIEDAQKQVYNAENLPEGASFDPATRTLTWTPTYDQSGNYEIPISLTDGEFTIKQTLAVTITHVNRPATLEDIPAQTIDENQALLVSAQYNDPDKEDEGKLQLTVSNLPEGATFNAASGEISWTPTYDQAGSYANITVSVKDPTGVGADKSFAITVNNINRPPELNPVGGQTVAENGSLSLTFQGTDPDIEDAGKLKYSGENLPQGATLDPANGTLSWTPGFSQAGSYQISIKLTDVGGLSAELSVPVEVTDVNRPPQLQSVQGQTADEGAALSFSLSATDEDTDNQLTYSINNLPDGATLNESSGQFSWSPDFNQAGNYTLAAKVSDGKAESTINISVTVNDINRAPKIDGGGSVTVTVGETATLRFSASDPDGDNLTFESNDLPSGATLGSGNGNFSWTPSNDQTGNFSFTVIVTDGKESASTTGSINVNPKPEPTPEPPTTTPAETTPPQ
jgi:hypothetical protein